MKRILLVAAAAAWFVAALTPAVAYGATRVEQTDSRVYYHGAWFRIDNASLSAGNMAKSVTQGSGAYLTFKGTGVDIIALKSPRYGIARIILDEAEPVLVDFYDPGASWRSVAWSVSGLDDTTHTVGVEYTGLKNPLATMYELNVDAFDVTGTIPDFHTHAEQDDTRLYFEPMWSTVDDGRSSGETYNTADSAGAGYATFRGTSVSVLAARGPGMGIATVKVDDVATQTVDLYSPVESFQEAVWTLGGLSDTSHTVTVGWTGDSNPASGGTSINVDAFETRGHFGQHRGRFETSDQRMYLSPDWYNVTSAHLSSESMAKASEADDVAYLTFEGTEIDLIGLKTANYGIARVSLDDGPEEAVDLYSPTDQWQAKLWSAKGLADETHTVRFRYTGEKNAASSGYAVCLDAVDVMGTLLPAVPNQPLLLRYEQTSPSVGFMGQWAGVTSAPSSAGSFARSGAFGDTTYLRFNGSAVKWITHKAPNHGIALVTIDGEEPELVDLFAPTNTWKSKVWTRSGLSETTHTVTIEYTGLLNPASSSSMLGVDAFDVKGTVLTPPKRYEQTDERITRTGPWTTYTSAALSGGSYVHSTAGKTSAVTVRFVGTGINWITTKAPGFGIARVSLDDDAGVDVDLYRAGSAAPGQHAYRVTGLPHGEHTLTITTTGLKNAASTGTYVGVDAFDIEGSLSQAPTRYEHNDSRIAFTGVWTTYSHPALSGGSYMHSRPGSGAITIKFDGTGIDYYTSTGPDYGIASLQLDDQTPVQVDLRNGDTRWHTQQRMWSARALEPGEHTLTITYTGAKSAGSTNTYIGLDAVEVVGELLQAQ